VRRGPAGLAKSAHQDMCTCSCAGCCLQGEQHRSNLQCLLLLLKLYSVVVLAWPQLAVCTCDQPDLQAQGLGEVTEQYNEWVQHRRSFLMLLMQHVLGTRMRTHVLVLRVEYQAGKRVSFQVGC
jgi:hypothetical protein